MPLLTHKFLAQGEHMMESTSNSRQAFKSVSLGAWRWTFQHLMAYRSVQDLADFTVVFGNRERRVHRVMLAHRSEYFAKLFRNDFEVPHIL